MILLLFYPVVQKIVSTRLQRIFQLLSRTFLHGLLHDDPFQAFEIAATNMAGKPGDRGLRYIQFVRQLSNGHTEKLISVPGDVLNDHLFCCS